MRKRLSWAAVAFAAVVVSSVAPSAAVADGLLYQLPKDGAWVLFDLKMETTRGDEQKTGDGSLRMSSVGIVTEDGFST